MHTMSLLGQFLIGLFFVFMAVYNFVNRTHMMEMVRARHTHVPMWVSGLVVLLEGLGGLMVMFNFSQRLAAIVLIILTLAISYVLHPFWKVKGREMWKHLWIIMGNIAVIGGLLLVLAMNG